MIDAGISVYAGLDCYSKEKNSEYLKLAASFGCKYVFSTNIIFQRIRYTCER